MSPPKGKCAFCGKLGDLTKSHVWPEWAHKILPQLATHHYQIIGEFQTFKPIARGPEYSHRVKQGHVGARKPRNTCQTCNSGWMRLIEENTMPFLDSLILAKSYSLNLAQQQMLAALLCLVSIRLEVSWWDGPKAIPQSDKDWLMENPEPPANWKIWIAKHIGTHAIDQQHTPMQIVSSDSVAIGAERCNTQVTSLVVGQFYAHLFSSTDWTSFPGYDGIALAQLWPPEICDYLDRFPSFHFRARGDPLARNHSQNLEAYCELVHCSSRLPFPSKEGAGLLLRGARLRQLDDT